MSPFAGYDDFDACVSDNSDKSDPEAYCAEIKRQVKGESSLSESEQKALEASECPEGHYMVDGECKEIESVDAPPSVLQNSAFFELAGVDTEPIEREELGDNKVAYRNVAILQSGVWTDSASRETIWYSPKGLSNLKVREDNAVNIMHDADNEVSEAGYIEPDSIRAEGETLYADLIIETGKPAGQYADENLQKTLETEGAKGFGGPSVEIDAEGQEVEYNSKKGMRELLGGILSGLGLVKNPASKPVSFARQTAKRGVALSEGEQTTMVLESETKGMSDNQTAKILSEFSVKELAGPQEVEEEAQSIADELDVPVDEVLEVLDPLFDMEEEEEEQEMQEDEEEENSEAEEGDGEDEEESEEEEEDGGDDVDIEMKVESLEERVSNMEEMMESAMAAEDVKEELEEFEQDLADAETVQELSEAKEDLEKRLSDLEDKPDYKTLSDNEDDEEDVEGNVHFAGSHDPVRGTYSR